MKTLRLKLIYIISAIVIGATVLVGTFFALSSAGVFDSFGNKLVIKSHDVQLEYNGQTLTGEQFSIEQGELGQGHTAKVVSSTSSVVPIQTQNVLTVGIFDASGNDVTDKYTIEYEYGKFEVLPCTLDLKTESATFLYKKEQTYSKAELTVGEQVLIGEQITLFTGDILSAQFPVFSSRGEHENKPEITIVNKDGQDVSAYYNIVTDYGKINVNYFVLTFTTHDIEEVYTGYPIMPDKDDLFKEIEGKQEGHKYSVVEEKLPRITQLGEGIDGSNSVENKFSIVVRDAEGNNITDAYTFEGTYGTITVLPRKLGDDGGLVADAKEYDGKQEYSQRVNYSDKDRFYNLAEGQTLSLSCTTSQSNVGEYTADLAQLYGQNPPVSGGGTGSEKNILLDQTFELKVLDAQGNDVTKNYDLQETQLKITINPKKVQCNKLSVDDLEKVYDGNPFEKDFEKIDKIAQGQTLNVKIDKKDAGKYTDQVPTLQVFSDGEDVTTNYIFENQEQLKVDLEITKAPLIITTNSAKKNYDNTPLTDAGFSQNGAVLGQEINVGNVNNIGSQTEVGSSFNFVDSLENIEIDIKDANGDPVDLENYEVEIRFGVLEVLDAEGNPKNPGTLSGSGPLSSSGDGTKDTTPLFNVNSNTTGVMYLKSSSSGDYMYMGWGDAKTYTGAGSNPQSYFASVLEGNGEIETKISVKELGDGTPIPAYLVAYYAKSNSVAYKNSTDSVYNYLGSISPEYTLDFYCFDYWTNQEDLSANLANDSEYYSYACENYLQVPNSTREYLENYLECYFAENNSSKSLAGWQKIVNSKAGGEGASEQDKNSARWEYDKKIKDLINEVSSTVKSFATYNLEFDHSVDAEGNPYTDCVQAFLEQKEGICQHFATTGTLIFRMLGIPARYTVGFCAEVDQTSINKDVAVTADRAHAWVEIYLEGYGWLPVEVTAGSGDDSTPSGNAGGGVGDFNKDDSQSKPINVQVFISSAFEITVNISDCSGKGFELMNSHNNLNIKVGGDRPIDRIEENTIILTSGHKIIITIDALTHFEKYSGDMEEHIEVLTKTGSIFQLPKEIIVKTGRWFVEAM